MHQDNLRKAQLCQLEIAKEVKRICELNDIKYSLMFGSMLGAIRHKGFIPWDDDLDIGFLRTEYDKFIAACERDLDSRYFLQTYETDPYFTWPYAKIQKKGTVYREAGVDDRTASGIFIDIFPIENTPKYAKVIRLRYKYYLKLLQIKSNYTITIAENKKVLKVVMRLLSKLYNKDKLKAKVRAMAQYCKDDSSKYVYCIYSPYSLNKEVMPRKWFKKFISVDFEGEKFSVLKEYDKYLRHVYGDYMQLPPESERENRHQILEVYTGE